MIDMLASAPHYLDHLAAVRAALPPEARGAVMVEGSKARAKAVALGFEPVPPDTRDRPILVAAAGDLSRAKGRLRKSRIALMEHGSGQSYAAWPPAARHAAYAGGLGRTASLFLHPGPHPAGRDRRAYPHARVEIVGSPHLDTLPARVGEPGRVVAVSFHFNAAVAPETSNAWLWIWPTVARLAKRFQLLGHAHPTLFDAVANRYRNAGIEPVRDFAEVCRRADVYVVDNSSTLFAFASTGRPVVVLNPPKYSRRRNHGLRFWEAAEVGVNVNRPESLADAIEEALADHDARRAMREEALGLVYAYRTGAAARAAAALMDWAGVRQAVAA